MLLTAGFILLVGGDFGAEANGTAGRLIDTAVLPWDLTATESPGRAGVLPIPIVQGESLTCAGLPSFMNLEGGNESESAVLDAVRQGKENPAPSDMVLNLGVSAEWSMPFGTALHHAFTVGGVVYVDRHVSWDDVFEPGWGANLRGDIYFGSRETSFNSGVGILLSTNQFGLSQLTNDLGGRISFDRMTMSTLMIGGTFLGSVGDGFYTKGFAGIGPVRYSSVSATFTGTFATFDRQVFRDTWEVAGDLRFDFGYRFGHFAIFAAAGTRIQAPPQTSAGVSVNTGVFWTFDVNLGVEVGF